MTMGYGWGKLYFLIELIVVTAPGKEIYNITINSNSAGVKSGTCDVRSYFKTSIEGRKEPIK